MKRLGWSGLNKSQQQAVTNCVGSRTCQHECTVKLVWGPPGTGKTSTVAFLLHFLLKERHPTVTCAPTNVVVLEVAERLVRRVTSKGNNRGYGLGDVVLFGNGDRMQMDHHDELRAVFLDCRVDMLTGCFASKIGWRDSLAFMISLLNEGSVGEVSEQKEKKPLTKEKDKRHCYGIYNDYLNSFDHLVGELKLCIEKLCKNLPTSVLSLEVVRSMFEAGDTLTFLQTVLRSIAPEELMHLFSIDYDGEDPGVLAARDVKRSSLSLLRSLSTVLDLPFYGEFINRKDVMKYSLEKASLVFCTVSGTAKLHALGVSPWQFLVIDEAAQLKECESAIPLQLPKTFNSMFFSGVLDYRCLSKSIKSIGDPIENTNLNDDPIIDDPILNDDPIIDDPILNDDPIIDDPILNDDPIIDDPILNDDWNNKINSCIASSLRYQSSMDSCSSENYNDSSISSYICGERVNSNETESSSTSISTDDSDLTITESSNDNDLGGTKKYKHLWVQCEECYGLNYKKFFKLKLNICETLVSVDYAS